MIKKIPVFILITLVLIGCRKKEIEEPLSWSTIDFKTKYTLEVPPGFTGGMVRHVEGATFSGATADQRIQLIYSYCTPLYCNEFGDTLKKPFPDSIQIPSNSAQLLTLTKTQVIIQNSDTVGILYYNYKEIAKGRLYWKDDTFFKQAVEIDFYMSELESVTKIINSISRK